MASVALDPSSANLFVAGDFTSVADFGQGDTMAVNASDSDSFVLSLSPDGATNWQKTFAVRSVASLAVDAWGAPILLGALDANPVALDGKTIPAGGGFYAAKLEPTRGTALWVTSRAPAMGAAPRSIAAAPSGHLVLAGGFGGTIDVVAPATMTATASQDMFFIGLSP